MSRDEIEGFGLLLGPPFDPVALPPDKELAAVTTIAEDGYVSSATNWHHDQSFAERPPDWSMLACISPGRNSVPTVFCDAAALLTFLSDGFIATLRRLSVRHAAYYPEVGQNENLPVAEAVHPLIIPVEGGIDALFAAPATASKIDGWSVAESQLILGRLYQMLNWPELTVRHSWGEGDMLVWPNRRYPHRALPFPSGSRRELARMVGNW
jgi:alpha-ketoglutarate-dependent taurine dioxygenase